LVENTASIDGIAGFWPVAALRKRRFCDTPKAPAVKAAHSAIPQGLWFRIVETTLFSVA
jgi:hypothetical protein